MMQWPQQQHGKCRVGNSFIDSFNESRELGKHLNKFKE